MAWCNVYQYIYIYMYCQQDNIVIYSWYDITWWHDVMCILYYALEVNPIILPALRYISQQ